MKDSQSLILADLKKLFKRITRLNKKKGDLTKKIIVEQDKIKITKAKNTIDSM